MQGNWGGVDEDVDDICPEIILGNTYHLASQPGTSLGHIFHRENFSVHIFNSNQSVVAELGGLHKFMNWRKCLLTDSGGFQMVSLLKASDR